MMMIDRVTFAVGALLMAALAGVLVTVGIDLIDSRGDGWWHWLWHIVVALTMLNLVNPCVAAMWRFGRRAAGLHDDG